MPEAQQGLAALRLERDLDPGRSGRKAGVSLPTPGEHDSVRWIDLLYAAAGDVRSVDIEAEEAARARVDRGLGSHPLHELVGVDQVGEDGADGRRYALLDYRFDDFRSSASASRRNRSTFSAHIRRR